MRLLVVLAAVVPLVVAGLLGAGTSFLPRRVIDALSILTSGAVAVMCGCVAVGTAAQPVVYWFGGWTPRGGVAIGVSFVAEPLGAGGATVAAILVTAALVYSWRYFEATGSFYHALVLVLLAGMVGLSLSGDLFNLFVFLELTAVAAVALTGYRIEQAAPLQGALNLAVSNAIGGFMVLIAIGLVYGRTGTLNLAAAGRSLTGAPADGLVIAAFTLVVAGLLVRAAAVPFHLWFPDAQSVAPSPVDAVLAGVFVELGLLVLARIWWTVFSSTGLTSEAVRTALLVIAAVTALVGAIMTVEQRHLKRMLGFSTVATVGVLLMGVAIGDPRSIGGVSLLFVEHAFVKGGLFLVAGIVLHRLSAIDIQSLAGRGRRLVVPGIVFALGGLALSGLQLPGVPSGFGIIAAAASGEGIAWVVVIVVATALTGGAILGAAGRIFLGWGPPRSRASRLAQPARERELLVSRRRTPPMLLAPPVALLVIGVAAGNAANLASRAQAAAQASMDRERIAAVVLDGGSPAPIPTRDEPVPGALPGAIATVGALMVAWLVMFRQRLRGSVRDPARRASAPFVAALRAAHSGHIGDHVLWLTAGTAVLGLALTFWFR